MYIPVCCAQHQPNLLNPFKPGDSLVTVSVQLQCGMTEVSVRATLVCCLRDSPVHAPSFNLRSILRQRRGFGGSICSTRPCTLNLSIVRPLLIWICWMWLALLRLVGERRDELRIVRVRIVSWLKWRDILPMLHKCKGLKYRLFVSIPEGYATTLVSSRSSAT